MKEKYPSCFEPLVIIDGQIDFRYYQEQGYKIPTGQWPDDMTEQGFKNSLKLNISSDNKPPCSYYLWQAFQIVRWVVGVTATLYIVWFGWKYRKPINKWMTKHLEFKE